MSDQPPSAADFKALYDSTGWGSPHRNPDDYARALAGSWRVVAAYGSDAAGKPRLVGFARLISDGVLHAYVNEMIVHPEAQGQGLGSRLLKELLAICQLAGITDIQLFSARGKRGFYERHGFVARPDEGPGMQYLPGA
ncbi:GNAT family N-acetyltransferase [Paucibacter sp. APW11]|uniref:GNAT family N-acetyltransferase n=1 Tax=Roseateles aquae TaxID=3077235 RepID=A0ABU3PH24_9BURK|nr:GNAT family N-acetyltransferase [Paucibacter sp. APW11]MDT9001833.1 GNAT family N-acetyltransferase [Paucibacter sp. APW11]